MTLSLRSRRPLSSSPRSRHGGLIRWLAAGVLCAGGLSAPVSAQGWSQTYRTPDSYLARDLVCFGGGKRAMIGYVTATTSGFWILDEGGNVEIARNPTTEGDGLTLRAITQSPNGNFIVCGRTDSTYQPVLVEVRASTGAATWSRRLEGADGEIRALAVTTDGSIVGVGHDVDEDGNYNALVVRFREDGTILWRKSIGPASTDELGLDVVSDGANGVVVSGMTNGFNFGDDDAWVARIDADGEIVWQRRIGTYDDDQATHIRACASGGYVFLGTSVIPGRPILPWVARLDPSGATLWEREMDLAASQRFGGIEALDDDSIVLMTSDAYSGGSIRLAGLDATGTELWQMEHETSGAERYAVPNCLALAEDQSLAVTASVQKGSSSWDHWSLRLPPNGSIGRCCTVEQEANHPIYAVSRFNLP